ncbi:MAG: ABC transporter ATP-binding protein [Lachnospiraceae bacterium]|jgi:ABC-2 type transport system ATP-binding protein|nr:ABC transporter ATP-binding protein [Lachnospiraceae bacterium]MCI8997332.1 ABC transporter ATP-binding protein [Lachnospiraceae bacterium]MCI9134473.1 ABC transporter ATP-binding protein [Lachnospiraceae bacterium]
MEAIKVEGLTKRYENFKLEDVTFSIPEGSIVGFIGENGAGKTTTLKAILGLIRPEAGKVEILGHGIQEGDGGWKEEIGVVFDESCFPENLTPQDVEKILRKVYRRWDSQAYHKYLERFSLQEKKRIKDMSRGMKMKFSLAVALSHEARLLILDEATSGLDPVVRSEILDLFLEFIQNEEHTIFLSSHITSDIEKISDYILFLHQGRILLYENKDTLTEQYGLVRGSEEQLSGIGDEHCKGIRKNAFGCEMLVDNRRELEQTGAYVVDQINLDDLMVFLAKRQKA